MREGYFMRFETLEIPEVILLHPDRFEDSRGYFSESFNKKNLRTLLEEMSILFRIMSLSQSRMS